MASSAQERVASRLISKQKSSDTTAEMFKSYRYRNKKRSKRERSRVGANKRPGR